MSGAADPTSRPIAGVPAAGDGAHGPRAAEPGPSEPDPPEPDPPELGLPELGLPEPGRSEPDPPEPGVAEPRSPEPGVPELRRRIFIVSGPPAAGKSAIAGPLAAELGCVLIAKDRIKEALHDALGDELTLAWSRQLGAAAMEVLWTLASDAPSAVLDANFWPGDERHQAWLRALRAVPVEVHCACPVQECMRRYAARAPGRHPVHLDGHDSRAAIAGFERCARPLRLGPVITVDTTRPVDMTALAVGVREHFEAADLPE